jgi:hypothetical protein
MIILLHSGSSVLHKSTASGKDAYIFIPIMKLSAIERKGFSHMKWSTQRYSIHFECGSGGTVYVPALPHKSFRMWRNATSVDSRALIAEYSCLIYKPSRKWNAPCIPSPSLSFQAKWQEPSDIRKVTCNASFRPLYADPIRSRQKKWPNGRYSCRAPLDSCAPWNG